MKYIFLADDDADDRDFFADALNELSIATELTTVSDGVELMNILDETVDEPPPPHIIFLDLNMPRKNGFECLKEIRETPKLKNIPIVIFSTTANEDSVNKTYTLGANCFICKPSSHQLLKKSIEAVLSIDLWDKSNRVGKEKFNLVIS